MLPLWLVENNPTMQLTEFRTRITECLVRQGVTPDASNGCTSEEINRLMQKQGVRFLPDIYTEFLRLIGKGHDKLRWHGEWSSKTLLVVKESAVRLLVGDGSGLNLSDDDFVFYESDGYIFSFFPTKERQSDPKVYLYSGQSGGFGEYKGQLSDYLIEFVCR